MLESDNTTGSFLFRFGLSVTSVPMSNKDEHCLFTVIRTSDAERKQISFSLSKTLGELKEILAKEFDIASDESQRIFYMGRELKSGGRSLQKLGLGRFNNNVLHVHIPPAPPPPEERKATGSGTKRRRVAKQDTVSPRTNSTNCDGEGIIEIVDESDDETSKRRR